MLQPSRFALSLPLLALAACSSDGGTVTNPPDSGADASTTDGSTSGRTDGGISGTDAGSEAGPSSPRTAAGESCLKADVPAAGTVCPIVGTYDVTEYRCTSSDPACPSPATSTPFTWTATVTNDAGSVKLTNGTDRLLRCTVQTGCTCTTSSGDVEYRFSATGFVVVGVIEGCASTTPAQYRLTKGTRR
ncbi:MAG: hypothetical protein U0169_00735 [Polyangiaceae bacterium]